LSIGVFLLTGCQWLQSKEEERKPVARVYDQLLYHEDLSRNIPENTSSEDSIVLAKSLIRNWIEKQLMIYQAETNLTDEKKNVEEQLREFRADLLIYAYQSELIRQKMDTIVTDEEIENYYTANRDNFELKDYIVRVNYVKTELNAPKLDRVESWLLSSKEKDREKLEDYCFQFATNFYLDDESWLYLDDFLKEVPIEVYNKEKLLKNQRLVRFTDSTHVYMVRIKDYRLKDSISPLSLERENIRSIILNKRKLSFINELRQQLFEQAERKNNFEIYSVE